MPDMNKLYLKIPLNCVVCGMVIVEADRSFFNPDDGQVIHYDCFVSILTNKEDKEPIKF